MIIVVLMFGSMVALTVAFIILGNRTKKQIREKFPDATNAELSVFPGAWPFHRGVMREGIRPYHERLNLYKIGVGAMVIFILALLPTVLERTERALIESFGEDMRESCLFNLAHCF
ncbi:MAG: hypothetical protein AAGE89_05065 [Pseudomonadota bacterium]